MDQEMDSKKELEFYIQLRRELAKMKGFIQDDLFPAPLSDKRADQLGEAIELLRSYCLLAEREIDAQIDDLENE
jgi:hypothetical protein